MLIPKARGALQRYGHQIVVGNDLNRRKFEVVFVERKAGPAALGDSISNLAEDEFTETWVRLSEEEMLLNEERLRAGSQRRPSMDPVDRHQVRPWRGKYGEKEIEEDIVDELIRRHSLWINEGPTQKGICL